MKRYRAILGSLYNTQHCILPEKFFEIESFVLARSRGEAGNSDFVPPEPLAAMCYDLDGQEFAFSEAAAAKAPEPQTKKYVAVLPLFGTMWQHGGMEMEYSGGTSTDAFANEIRRLDANTSIPTVVINAHTPGGQAWGTEEAANVLYNARQMGRTRFITVANSQMASAGIWVGTAANEVYITPGGEAGSIGVLNVHQDMSKSEEMQGVKTTLVAYPEKKVEGHEFAPLDESARESLMVGIMHTYKRFTQAVARNRGVTPEKVESEFGGGGMLRADEAVTVGLANGIATLHEVVNREVEMLKRAGRSSVRNQAALLGK
jgi:ClpP class serine protease